MSSRTFWGTNIISPFLIPPVPVEISLQVFKILLLLLTLFVQDILYVLRTTIILEAIFIFSSFFWVFFLPHLKSNRHLHFGCCLVSYRAFSPSFMTRLHGFWFCKYLLVAWKFFLLSVCLCNYLSVTRHFIY